MSLRFYILVLRERWKIVATTCLAALLVSLTVFSLLPSQYSAQVSLYVLANAGGNAETAYEGNLLSQQRVLSFTELVTSPRVIKAAKDELGLAEDLQSVTADVQVTSREDSIIIDVRATRSSPEQAANLANSISREFSRLIADLERPSDPRSVPAVSVRIIEPALPPSTPSSLSLLTTLGLALIVGAALGVAMAIVRHSLDNTIRGSESASEATGVSVIGTLFQAGREDDSELVMARGGSGRRAEAFRQLRSNLQFVTFDQPRAAVAITSSVAGEGKSTTTVDLAYTLSSAGYRVCILDADLRRPRIAQLMQIDGNVGLTTLLSRRVSTTDALQFVESTLAVITSGPTPPNPSELLTSSQFRTALNELRERFDLVLVDTPPLLAVADALGLANAVDSFLILCKSGSTKVDQLQKSVATLSSTNARIAGIVMNFAQPPTDSSGDGYYSYRPQTDVSVKPLQQRSEGGIGNNDPATRPSPRRR